MWIPVDQEIGFEVHKSQDPEIFDLLAQEEVRQRSQLSLVASENYSSPAVRALEGSVFAYKNAEGYPGRRYAAGCEQADMVENLAIERAKKVFGCEHANVQSMSATIANVGLMKELFRPGSTLMSMSLQDGGHFSHGASFHMSGREFEWAFYGVSRDDECLDYDALRSSALRTRPAAIICGGSSYPRLVDYDVMAQIAREVDALLWVDLSHTAGLVAGGAIPSPFPHADVVTTSTHKTLRGPRGGGLILSKADLARQVDRSVFPGLQGAPKMDMIASRAVLLKEVQSPQFRTYARHLLSNAAALGDGLSDAGTRLVSGGTSSHLVLVDVGRAGKSGLEAESALFKANVVSNRNAIPFDALSAATGGGLRLGTAAMTTRGLDRVQFENLGRLVGEVITSRNPDACVRRLKSFVEDHAGKLPLFHDMWLPQNESPGQDDPV